LKRDEVPQFGHRQFAVFVRVLQIDGNVGHETAAEMVVQDVVADVQLEEQQVAAGFQTGRGGADVHEELVAGILRIVRHQIRAVRAIDAEGQLPHKPQLQPHIGVHVQPQRRDADVEVHRYVRERVLLPEPHRPFQLVIGFAVRVQVERGGDDVLHRHPVHPPILEPLQAGGAERVVQGLLHHGRGVVEVLAETVAQFLNHVRADVADEVGGVLQPVADQRPGGAEDLAGQHVLKRRQHVVDPVEHSAQVVQQIEVTKQALEIRHQQRRTVLDVPHVGDHQVDVAQVRMLGGKVHRQVCADLAGQRQLGVIQVQVRQENLVTGLTVVQQHADRHHVRAAVRIAVAVDQQPALLDPNPQRPQRRRELDVVSCDRDPHAQLAGLVQERPGVERVADVDAAVQVEHGAGRGVQLAGGADIEQRAQVLVVELRQIELEGQLPADRRFQRHVDPDHRVVLDQRQIDQRFVQPKGLLDPRLDVLQHRARILLQRRHELQELGGVVDDLRHRPLDAGDVLIQPRITFQVRQVRRQGGKGAQHRRAVQVRKVFQQTGIHELDAQLVRVRDVRPCQLQPRIGRVAGAQDVGRHLKGKRRGGRTPDRRPGHDRRDVLGQPAEQFRQIDPPARYAAGWILQFQIHGDRRRSAAARDFHSQEAELGRGPDIRCRHAGLAADRGRLEERVLRDAVGGVLAIDEMDFAQNRVVGVAGMVRVVGMGHQQADRRRHARPFRRERHSIAVQSRLDVVVQTGRVQRRVQIGHQVGQLGIVVGGRRGNRHSDGILATDLKPEGRSGRELSVGRTGSVRLQHCHRLAQIDPENKVQRRAGSHHHLGGSVQRSQGTQVEIHSERQVLVHKRLVDHQVEGQLPCVLVVGRIQLARTQPQRRHQLRSQALHAVELGLRGIPRTLRRVARQLLDQSCRRVLDDTS